ncbi:MAG: DNA-directed RNA polymerase [Candidatus Lokiarchaeota archaeon]|nr:DNA-directed RNA polymerase [Candidatus Lokiarchaeota archaeon]
MFKLIEIESTISIPPNRFYEDIDKVALEILQKNYEEKITSDLGFIIAVDSVTEVGIGKLIPGDGAAHHNCRFKILVFKPNLHEVVEGKIVEVVDFGVFIRLGCIDGLVHVSQITNDFITFDGNKSMLVGKETGFILKENDVVRARIVAVSIGAGGTRSGKLGLTMRQDWLGKIEWIDKKVELLKEGVPEKELDEKTKKKSSEKESKKGSKKGSKKSKKKSKK